MLSWLCHNYTVLVASSIGGDMPSWLCHENTEFSSVVVVASLTRP